MKFTGGGNVMGEFAAASPVKDFGHWWLPAPKICFHWRNWMDGEPHCFQIVFVDASPLRWLGNDGEEGIARFVDAGGRAQ